jgi:FkbM family methyltransferase
MGRMQEGLSALDELLSEPREAALRRARQAFSSAVHPVRDVVLFGAGGLGRRTLRGLRRIGIEPRAFADNAAHLWGTKIEGIPVLSPRAAAAAHGREAAFVIAIWNAQQKERLSTVAADLRALGCDRVATFAQLYWEHPETFLPYYAIDLPHHVLDRRDEVRAAACLFRDAASLEQFVSQVRWRLWMDFASLPEPVAHEMYFPEDLIAWNQAGTLVDCGAFDGDTLRRWIARFPSWRGRAVAFEPDPENFARLEKWHASLDERIAERIDVRRQAVAARTGSVRFDATGTGSAAAGHGASEVDAVALDDALREEALAFVKMDTEGSELDALRGAAGLLRVHQPPLALCAYHRQSHLWEIPLLVERLAPGYRFFLRAHALNGWDLVCYAVPALQALRE